MQEIAELTQAVQDLRVEVDTLGGALEVGTVRMSYVLSLSLVARTCACGSRCGQRSRGEGEGLTDPSTHVYAWPHVFLWQEANARVERQDEVQECLERARVEASRWQEEATANRDLLKESQQQVGPDGSGPRSYLLRGK